MSVNRNDWTLGRSLAVALILGAGTILSTTALAGGCPADKMGRDVTKPVAMADKESTDTVLATDRPVQGEGRAQGS